MAQRLFLLDGMALAYRAYFAFIQNPLKNSKGENTSAVYGFINSLLKILDEEKPEYIAVAFDTPEPTFRHKQFQSYKATREKMPEDLGPQLHYLKELTEALGVPVIELPGYEADDIIGTLSVQAAQQGLQVYMVTGDKDFMQLISDRILMYNPLKKGVDKEIVGADGVREKFGVGPEAVTDILGLMGDTADNIPGVKGVGEKTAQKLIVEFGSIEKLYARLDEVKGKLRENLFEHKEDAFLSKKLATIDTNSPVKIEVKELKAASRNQPVLMRMLNELEFKSLVKKFAGSDDLFGSEPSSPAKKTTASYHVVTTEKQLTELAARLKKNGAFAWTTEATDDDPMKSDVIGVSFCAEAGEAYYLPFKDTLDLKSIIAALKPVWEDRSILKYGLNPKFDALALRPLGVRVEGIAFDAMIAGHLLHSDKDLNPGALAREYLERTVTPIADLIGTGKAQLSLNDVAQSRIAEFANETSDTAWQLHGKMLPLLKTSKSEAIFQEIEMPLLPVLADMEYEGVWLNLDILADMSKEFGRQIAVEERKIYKEAGLEFNLNSPQQLGEVLFEKLQIHKLAGIEKPKRTGKTKQYATDVKILEQYRSLPIIDAMLTYRQLTKLKSTYIDGLPPLLNPRTGRIHSTFSQTVAATGRLSSSNPNFQNIPIRTDMGREIRKAFTAQKKGWSLLSADYSQIELRVMAHMSGDEHLIEAFIRDEDIHTSTAARVFKLPQEQVTKDLRRKAKDINFGIIYGISPFGLAQRIGMSQAEAREFIQNYFATYPKVKTYIDSVIYGGHKDGFVTTLFGRRRYLSDLQSKNYTVRQFAERAATNTPIQGTAAEIIKAAMIKIHREMIADRYESKMILQVHDELVFEVPADELKSIQSLVRKNMETAVKLNVPLKVDLGIGDNWLETK